MLTKGDKVRVTREDTPQMPKIRNRVGQVYYADKFKIVVEFKALNSEESFRESFNIADLIEEKAKIEVKQGKKWINVVAIKKEEIK
jgi:hypothetical protein